MTLLALAYAASWIILALAYATAPEGFESDDGFHRTHTDAMAQGRGGENVHHGRVI